MTRDAEIKILEVENLDSFIEAEMNRKNKILQSIVESSAEVILCSGEVDQDILHMLSENGILVVGELDSSELRNASDSTGSRIIQSPLEIDEDALGLCGKATWEKKQSSDEVEDIIRIEDCPNPSVVTIEVGGAGEIGTEEVIRGLHDSLRATSLAMNEELLPGRVQSIAGWLGPSGSPLKNKEEGEDSLWKHSLGLLRLFQLLSWKTRVVSL